MLLMVVAAAVVVEVVVAGDDDAGGGVRDDDDDDGDVGSMSSMRLTSRSTRTSRGGDGPCASMTMSARLAAGICRC